LEENRKLVVVDLLGFPAIPVFRGQIQLVTKPFNGFALILQDILKIIQNFGKIVDEGF
jgi:hypothetical protein